MKETLIFLGTISGLLYFAGSNNEDTYLNQKNGMIGAIALICIVGSLKPTNPFKNGEWLFRLQLWLAITYNAFLVFLAFQNEKDGRQLMKLGDERLGIPVPKDMHTYDDNCEINWENIIDNLDHYYLSHVINWLLASFLVRDAWILNFWSILDEIIELSWQHKLPHFRECWWDHVFLDVLLSNTVAIFVGMWIIRKLGFQEYDWLGRKNNWSVFHNHQQFGALMVILVVIIINFLDGFFLMNQLWVPPKCWMVVYRLLIWFAMGHLAFRELHNSLHEKNVAFQARFITFFTLVIETFISIKFLKDCGNLQDVETSVWIYGPWGLCILGCCLWYLRLRW